MILNTAKIISFGKHYLRWGIITVLIGGLCGTASALFLAVLERTTELRVTHLWLLYCLPIGGFAVGWLYHAFGKEIEAGNNLVIDEFHDPTKVIPFRMAPLVLIGTIGTHLVGGSAGREGTAVQMGSSIADQFSSLFKFDLQLDRDYRRILLMAGMSGGFASVFGVPYAGTIFGLEVLAVGEIHFRALVECAITAFVAHYVALAWGIHHTVYASPAIPDITVATVASVIIAGLAFGLAAKLFAFFADNIQSFSKKLIPYLPLRACAGGALIALIYFTLPVTVRYSGLGIPVILDSLQSSVPVYDWFGKLVMTALTLATGFKGGEVTPLLFVGATLGNALGHLLPVAIPLLATVGFVGVFAGAANTPFTCTIMAMELFGSPIFIYAALASFAAYAISGHHGIYRSQRIHVPKNQMVSRTFEFLKAPFK